MCFDVSFKLKIPTKCVQVDYRFNLFHASSNSLT